MSNDSRTKRAHKKRAEARQSQTVDQDLYGYVSPSLRRLRDKPNKTQEEWDLLARMQAGRRPPEIEVNIPNLTQPTGQPQLANRNNNPGNMRFAGQLGAEKGDKSFARFDTPEIGFLALERKVRADKQANLTLEEFIYSYAPPFENNTENYLNFLMQRTGAHRSTPITQLDTRVLAEALAWKESKTTISPKSDGSY